MTGEAVACSGPTCWWLLPASRHPGVGGSRHACLVVHPGIVGDRGPRRWTGPSPCKENLGCNRAAGGMPRWTLGLSGPRRISLRMAGQGQPLPQRGDQAASQVMMLQALDALEQGQAPCRWHSGGARAASCDR